MAAALVIRDGGSVVLADRSESYQAFKPDSIVDAVTAFIADAALEGETAAASAMARLAARCVISCEGGPGPT